MMRFSRKRLEEVRGPQQANTRRLTKAEIKKQAICEGLKAVKGCWKDARITLGDIMEMDINSKKPANNHPNQLNRTLNKGQVLFVFKKAANDFSRKNGGEDLF